MQSAGNTARLSVASSTTRSYSPPPVIRLREITRGEDAESQVPEAPGDLQRAGSRRKRLVEITEQRVGVRHDCADPASPALVVQSLGEGLRLAQVLQYFPDFPQLVQPGP
jgi:hypothetical protein